MLDFDGLRKTLNDSYSEINIGLEKLVKDAKRVSIIAKNPSIVINDIDRKFEQATKLSDIDVSFLFLAVMLQIVRQYLVTNFKERDGHIKAAEKTEKIEDKFKKIILGDDNLDHLERSKYWYNPTFKEVLLNPVPFDTTFGSPNFNLNLGDNHRPRTLGHDPILGWIFGTMNIATSTVTLASLSPPLRSFHIRTGYDKIGRAKDKITHNADFSKILSHSESKMNDNKGDGRKILAVSIIKEWLHLCSDASSKNSLPIPLVPLLASPEFAIELSHYGLDIANIKTVFKQIALSSLINYLIAILHRLLFENNGGYNFSLYEVRTRNIITYSNIIASASNLLPVAILGAIGVVTENPVTLKNAISYLDIGGLLVTVHQLIKNASFIGKVKQEFLEEEFYRVVMGNDSDF